MKTRERKMVTSYGNDVSTQLLRSPIGGSTFRMLGWQNPS